jgi:hypothetical protein
MLALLKINEVVHLRELLILVLIVIQIAPLVGAIPDRTELMNSSANSLDSLISNEFAQKKSTANEQWISPQDIPNDGSIGSAEYSKEMALQQLSDLSSNLDKKKDHTIIGDSAPVSIAKKSTKQNSIPDVLEYLCRANYDEDPSLELIEESNSELLHKTDQNLDLLYSQGISYPSIENIRIASSYSPSDVIKNLGSLQGRIGYKYSPSHVALIENSNSHNEIDGNLDYLYDSGMSKNGQTARFDDAVKFTQSRKYRYEKKGEIAGHSDNLNFDIIVQDGNAVIEFPAREDGNHRRRVEYGDNELNNQAFDLKMRSDTNSNFNHLFNDMSQTDTAPAQDISPLIKYSSISDNLEVIQDRLLKMNKIISLDQIRDTPSKQNYAIVIGINNYLDRRSLHSSVNDANMFAALLEMYDYKVTRITDDTPSKPTKYNILDVALEEIKNKENRGNVIIYFSGHGDMNAKGNYFLLPQDANGAESSYISKDELNKHMKDIKNLAIIIDACNSGALGDLASQDQLILASSKPEEASNEEWIGDDHSVFTKNLCDAIRKEMALKGRVQLQKCFAEAQSNTIRWANSHFLSQTPNLTDRTSGKFYLN